MYAASNNLAELSDEELARRARVGSEPCFEELVRRFQTPLLRYLLRRLPRHVDAEDVLQEAFVRAYQRLAQYRDTWPFRTWMFTITRRLAIGHLRKMKPVEGEEALAAVSGPVQSPMARLGEEERRHHLWQTARQLLTEDQFSAVWLFYVEEMGAGDVARVLGRSWVGIKTMLHRARKRLLPHVAHWVDGAVDAAESVRVAKAGES